MAGALWQRHVVAQLPVASPEATDLLKLSFPTTNAFYKYYKYVSTDFYYYYYYYKIAGKKQFATKLAKIRPSFTTNKKKRFITVKTFCYTHHSLSMLFVVKPIVMIIQKKNISL